MAILVEDGSGRTIALAARVLVGRSDAAQMQLADRRVSSEHASIRWLGDGWQVRDLGSRNGTFLDGRRLGAGESAPLATGHKLSFGGLSGGWVLVDAGPPAVVAQCLVDGRRCTSEDGLLALPDAETASATVFRTPDGLFWFEDQDGARELRDADVVEVDGVAWRVLLPVLPLETAEGERTLGANDLTLTFSVSRDEEHVDVEVRWQGGSASLASRAHHYPLLVLARQRLADAAAGVADSEQGWIWPDALAKMLGSTQNHLNVSIHRIRKEFAALGVFDGAAVVERRGGSGPVRVGVRRLEVGSAS
jgi:hypothetical protein